MNFNMRLRYCMIDSIILGLPHPEIQMKNLGYKIKSSEPVSVADCWIFEVEEVFYPLPKYLELL